LPTVENGSISRLGLLFERVSDVISIELTIVEFGGEREHHGVSIFFLINAVV
jgi:hypothetical protein